MGGLIDRFLRWLQSDAKPARRTYGNPEVHPIDPDRLAKELNLEQEAERLGKKELPSSTDTTIFGPEARIVQGVEKARQGFADWGSGRVKLLNETINSIDLTPNTQEVLQLDTEFERRAGVLLTGWHATLHKLSAAVRECKAEFEAFQKNNGLHRPVQTLSNLERSIRIVVLVGLILIEGAVNSFFFAQGMWGGLLDGLIVAVLFAALNVVLAATYGRRFLPEVFHADIRRRLLGVALLAASLVLIFALALLIAHFRDAVTGGALDSAAKMAWASFKNTPTTLNDAYSVVLCAVSVVFALVATYDAFGLDDPYPGYGKCARKKEQAVADHAIEMDGIQTSLDELKAETLTHLDTLIDRAEVQLRQLDQAIAQKIETGDRLRNAFTDADNCLDALLRTFRTHNRVHRSTGPPAYFDWMPPLRDIAKPDFSTDQDRAKYSSQKAALEKARSNVAGIRANIQGAYSRLFDRVKSLDEHFPTAPN